MSKLRESVDTIQRDVSTIVRELETGSKGNQAAYTVQEGPLEASLSARLDQIFAALPNDDSRNAIQETQRTVQNIERSLQSGRLSASSAQPVEDILQLARETVNILNKLPKRVEIEEIANNSLGSFQSIKEDLIAQNDRNSQMLSMKVDEKVAGLVAGQEDLMRVTTEVESLSENYHSSVSKSYEQLLGEIKGLAKVEQVMIQTADNVMDTKRRIEYGVHQILLEVIITIISYNLYYN